MIKIENKVEKPELQVWKFIMYETVNSYKQIIVLRGLWLGESPSLPPRTFV